MTGACLSLSVAQGPSPEPSAHAPRRQPSLSSRPQFRRYLEENRAYLITTNTGSRRPLFLDPRLCAIVIDNLAFYRDRGNFSLHAWVLMPDHLHFVVTPRGVELPDLMRNLKSYCAKQIREAAGIPGPVWQSRFHDQAMRNEFQYRQAIEYIHQNPVKAGLVQSDEEYKYSSARAYAGLVGAALAIDTPDGSRLGP